MMFVLKITRTDSTQKSSEQIPLKVNIPVFLTLIFDLAGQLLSISLLLSAALKFTMALPSYFPSIEVKMWKVSFDRKYVIRIGNHYR